MLTIRDSQLSVFNRSRRAQFESRMASHLRHAYGEQTAPMSPAELDGFVKAGIQDAAAYGIEAEGAIAGFLELQVEFGKEFDLAPHRKWVLQILSHKPLPGSLKVSMVRDRLDSMTKGRQIVRFEAPPA